MQILHRMRALVGRRIICESTQTHSLVLQPLKITDCCSFVRLFVGFNNRELLWRDVPNTYMEGTLVIGREFIKRQLGQSSFFSVRENERFVGVVGFSKIDRQNNSGEIVIYLAQESRNMHNARKIILSILQYGFMKLGLNRIYFNVDPRNIQVVAMLEAHSPLVVREGLLREAEYVAGQYVDDIVFSVLKRDWDNRL